MTKHPIDADLVRASITGASRMHRWPDYVFRKTHTSLVLFDFIPVRPDDDDDDMILHYMSQQINDSEQASYDSTTSITVAYYEYLPLICVCI